MNPDLTASALVPLLPELLLGVGAMTLLILGTYRPHEGRKSSSIVQQARLQLKRSGSYREINLGFLGEPDCRAYLELEFPGCPFPAEFGALVRR